MSSKSILITGACGDIGRALAAEFAAAGPVRLALCDLMPPVDAEPSLAPLRELGATVLYRQVDVTDADALGHFTEDASATLQGLDICIANAGIVERGALIDLPVQAWRRTLEVNLTGCFLTAQAAARAMTRTGRGGHILFMSSWTQDVPRAGIGAYCASKGGLKMLAKTLALELGPHGIRVNLIAPGFVDAGLTGKNLRLNPERRPRVEAEVPLGALITAEGLARTVRLFCAEDVAYVTGTSLLIDGGASLSFRKAD